MGYKVLKAIVSAFCHIIFRIEIVGEENFPKSGSCMICANHLSNWDPVILIIAFKRKVHFLAKSELFKFKPLSAILNCAGVISLKRGTADMGAIKAAMEILKNDKVLGMFPTGTRTKNVCDKKPKSGAALIASRMGTNVVPIYIKSTYRIFSKVTIYIDKPLNLEEYKGVKLTTEELDDLSENIYSKIIDMSKKQG